MRALILYESMSGSSLRELAEVIAEGLSTGGASADLIEVSAAPMVFTQRVDLLVVGTATHGFGLPTQQIRADGARRGRDGQPGHSGAGIREWVDRVALDHGQPAATFDIKVDRPEIKGDRPRRPGSASRAAARRLRERGATIIGTQTFHLLGVEGPMVDGEIVHARAWAAGLVLDAAIHRVS